MLIICSVRQLYSEFAEPLELLEIILLIVSFHSTKLERLSLMIDPQFHVSDHRDPFLVTATWEAILSRGEPPSLALLSDLSTHLLPL